MANIHRLGDYENNNNNRNGGGNMNMNFQIENMPMMVFSCKILDL